MSRPTTSNTWSLSLHHDCHLLPCHLFFCLPPFLLSFDHDASWCSSLLGHVCPRFQKMMPWMNSSAPRRPHEWHMIFLELSSQLVCRFFSSWYCHRALTSLALDVVREVDLATSRGPDTCPPKRAPRTDNRLACASSFVPRNHEPGVPSTQDHDPRSSSRDQHVFPAPSPTGSAPFNRVSILQFLPQRWCVLQPISVPQPSCVPAPENDYIFHGCSSQFFEFIESVIIVSVLFLPYRNCFCIIFTTVMAINLLWLGLCTITDIVFLWNRHGRKISAFHHTTANASTPTLTHFPANFGCCQDNS